MNLNFDFTDFPRRKGVSGNEIDLTSSTVDFYLSTLHKDVTGPELGSFPGDGSLYITTRLASKVIEYLDTVKSYLENDLRSLATLKRLDEEEGKSILISKSKNDKAMVYALRDWFNEYEKSTGIRVALIKSCWLEKLEDSVRQYFKIYLTDLGESFEIRGMRYGNMKLECVLCLNYKIKGNEDE